MRAGVQEPLCASVMPLAEMCRMQAADEGKFGVGLDSGLAQGFADRLQAALAQPPGTPVPLCDQVSLL